MLNGRFYLYRIFYDDMTLYIGKGTGKRLSDQKRAFGVSGEIIAYFDDEREAYREEKRLIAEHEPPLNRIPGGTGGWSSVGDLRDAPNGLTPEGLGYAAPHLARLLIIWKCDQRLGGILKILGAFVDAHGLEKIEAAVVPHMRRLLFNNLATENK